jgi:hypothetical protein
LPDPRARAQPRLRKTVSALPDPRAQAQPRPPEDGLRLARPQGSSSTSTPEDGLRLARPQGSGSTSTSGRRSPPHLAPGLGLNLDLRTTVSASPGPRARTQPRPRRSHHLARADHATRGGIITLPLASPDYGEQDRCPIWLAPVKQVMMAPRVLHDNGGSQPLTEARRRQQGSDSPDSCASTGLKRSSDGHDTT